MAVSSFLPSITRTLLNSSHHAFVKSISQARLTHNHSISKKSCNYFVSSFNTPQLKERTVDYLEAHQSNKNPSRMVSVHTAKNGNGFSIKEHNRNNTAMLVALNELSLVTKASNKEIASFLATTLAIAPGAAQECTPKDYRVSQTGDGVEVTEHEVSSNVEPSFSKPFLDDYAESH